MGLSVPLKFVWKEHDPQLARHHIEGLIIEWQGRRIGLLPRDPIIAR
jgi:hypothetical protein